MKNTILPVPVLAETAERALDCQAGAKASRVDGEARESTTICPSVRGVASAIVGPTSRGGQKLFVVRQSSVNDRSRYFFYAVRGAAIVERVTARSASLIWDYLEANWPHGTRVYWIIL